MRPIFALLLAYQMALVLTGRAHGTGKEKTIGQGNDGQVDVKRQSHEKWASMILSVCCGELSVGAHLSHLHSTELRPHHQAWEGIVEIGAITGGVSNVYMVQGCLGAISTATMSHPSNEEDVGAGDGGRLSSGRPGFDQIL